MNKKLLAKSLNYRNEEAIKKLATLESIRVWANQPSEPLPKCEKSKIYKNNVGWYNFVLHALRELKP